MPLALFDQAEAVVLISDEPDDSEVLLVSFELEQLLGGMEAGLNTPKVQSCMLRVNMTCTWEQACACSYVVTWQHSRSITLMPRAILFVH